MLCHWAAHFGFLAILSAAKLLLLQGSLSTIWCQSYLGEVPDARSDPVPSLGPCIPSLTKQYHHLALCWAAMLSVSSISPEPVQSLWGWPEADPFSTLQPPSLPASAHLTLLWPCFKLRVISHCSWMEIDLHRHTESPSKGKAAHGLDPAHRWEVAHQLVFNS